MQSHITGDLRWHVSVFIVQSQRRWRHAEGEQEMCRWKTSKPWISRKARAEEIMWKRRLQERQCHLARLAPADKTALVFLADMHPSLALSLRSICWLCLTGFTVGRCWIDKICQSKKEKPGWTRALILVRQASISWMLQQNLLLFKSFGELLCQFFDTVWTSAAVAHLFHSEMVFSVAFLSPRTSLAIFGWSLASTRHFHSKNCCSLSIVPSLPLFYRHHSRISSTSQLYVNSV